MNGTTSVRFTEEMKGHISFGESDYERGARERCESDTRLMVHLTIEENDFDRLAADAGRAAEAMGLVECDALGSRLPVERGIFNLLIEEEDPKIKHMLYRLFFRDGVGHPITLAGFKTLTNRRGLHVWRDTTTLYARLLRGHLEAGEDPVAEVVASGILRSIRSASSGSLAPFAPEAADRRLPGRRPSSASTPSSSSISGRSTACTDCTGDSRPGRKWVGRSLWTGTPAVAGMAAEEALYLAHRVRNRPHHGRRSHRRDGLAQGRGQTGEVRTSVS
jgi:hypothetical protein